MRVRTRLALVVGMLAATPTLVYAQDTGRWAIDTGSGRATASTLSLNTLSTGSRVIDYHPVLYLSCDAKRFPMWRQSVQIRDSVSSERMVDVAVRMDNARAFSEQWTVAPKARSLQFDGDEGIARLSRARRFTLSWRFGLFSGRGEAVFNLVGVKDTVAELAEACGAPAPGST